MAQDRLASFAILRRLVGSEITLGHGSLRKAQPLEQALKHLDDAALAQAAHAAAALACDVVRQAATAGASPIFWWAVDDARGRRFRYAPRKGGVHVHFDRGEA
jgi:hypothetical protein